MTLTSGCLPVQESVVSRSQAESRVAEALDRSARVLALPLALMARFKRLMQYEGWTIDVPRMFTDTAYAHGCLVTARTSRDDRLRRTALSLFEVYGRSTTGPVLH